MKDPGIIAALSGAAAVNTVNSFLPPVNLVAPGVLDPRVSWARSQGGGVMATRQLADGSWEEVAQNVPRFNGIAQNLLMEGSRTNLIRNPRGEGAVAGTPGTPPTFSQITGMPSGATSSVLAPRSINGLPGTEIRFAGAASSTGNPGLLIEANALSFPLLPNTIYTLSMFNTLTGGSFANCTNFRIRVQGYQADGTTGTGDHLSPTMFPNSVQARYTYTFTTTALVAFGRVSVIATSVVGGLDFTIHMAAAQLEVGSFFSTPILPPVGTPGVAVRGADFGTATLASLGILPNGAANIQFRYRLYTSGFSAAPLMVLGQVDDGSDNNRAVSTLLNSSLVTRGTNVLAGVSTNLTLGTVSGASLIPFDMNIRGDGTTQFVGYYSTAPDDNTLAAPIGGAPVAGLTTFRLGNRFDASAPFFGEFASIVVLPRTDSPMTLVSPGVLSSAFTVSRAHTPSTASATRQLADGVTWAEVAQNLPRFHGVAQRLLVEGARTNLIRNPRGEGATPGVIGAGGVMPTFFSSGGGNPTGGVATVLASRSINGVPGAEITMSGNASTTGNPEVILDVPVVDTTVVGSTAYTISALLTLTAGSFANVTNFRLRCRTYLADGTTPVGDHLSTTMFPTATQARYTFTFTTGATAAFARMSITTATAVGVLDYTIHYGAPQFEQGAFASTPILPVVGTPAAATRAEDRILATLATLGLTASGACTLSAKVLRTTNTAGAVQPLFHVDDGSANNRFYLQGSSNSVNHTMSRTNAGASGASPSIVGPAAGTSYNAGMRLDGAGNASAYITGATLQSVAGGATAGLLNLRIGCSVGGGFPYWGEIERVQLAPYIPGNPDFRRMVDTIP